ncbi:MAG: hypothetical protein WKF82_03490 [Nocardioidaceae bacterium]
MTTTATGAMASTRSPFARRIRLRLRLRLITRWLAGRKQSGHFTAGSPREVYFAEWDQCGDDDLVCDVAWPIRRAS